MKSVKVLLLLLIVAPIPGRSGTASNADHKYFTSAQNELKAMLDGSQEASFERAIYLIENAWWDGKISYSEFQTMLDFHTQNIKQFSSLNNALNNNPVSDFKGTKEHKIKIQEDAINNYAIFNYLTKPSVWVTSNTVFNHKPYTYSNSDPLGTNDWTNTHVTHLLSTNKGNCFALASLFKIFSDRLSSDAILCTAPGHIYIRHTDNNGIYYNVELSSHSFPGTGTIETLTYTSNEASKNNISLRELEAKQAIALCLVYLAKNYEYKFGLKDDEFMLSCAEIAINYDAQNLNAMLLKADVLESRLISKSKSIATLCNTSQFKTYQDWISHIYSLGYREMPYEMKNLLLKGWAKDTLKTIGIKLQANNVADISQPATRYASLSWGLFDEEIKTKPLERYRNTVFDTKNRKIVGFLDDDILYKSYVFDPVAFAWNIDPMAHKFPHASPYNFVENNPISRIDPDGNEWVNAYDARVSMLEASAKKNPTDKGIQRDLAQYRALQSDANSVMNTVKTKDPDLYNYIDNLTVKMTKANGDVVDRNVQVMVGVDWSGRGQNGQVGQTTHDPGGPDGEYNGSSIVVPISKNSEGKRVVGFNVTIFGAEGSSFRDGTLANEAGDVMYYMEFNGDAVKAGSDQPGKDSYFKDGGAGNYSQRVQETYQGRMKSSNTGSKYPLSKSEK